MNFSCAIVFLHFIQKATSLCAPDAQMAGKRPICAFQSILVGEEYSNPQQYQSGVVSHSRTAGQEVFSAWDCLSLGCHLWW